MTGYACPKYQKENSKGDLIVVDAPGQPHALRYLLDRQARATHGMYRAFINVLCASLNRNSPIIGETAEVINLREAIVQNPPFCRYIQDEREKKWLEEMLQDVPLNEEAGIQWTKQVGGRTTRPLYR